MVGTIGGTGNKPNPIFDQRAQLMRDLIMAGYTIRQVAAAFGFASTSGVVYALYSRGLSTTRKLPAPLVTYSGNTGWVWANRDAVLAYITGEEDDDDADTGDV